ncbi:methyltransferase [Legionella lansingensis]|uniref:Methyltransferase n=1 Tax=Legionella lansingensis TaxID=45067 RepID=A0A0W0VPX2_9GAMM|nr:class I SAM-dependent methyltransferase [Legionella lansingensis]KTD22156.1 methyltransferase [Legionella lansingensis]SNV54563.1 methyltransferase [Legionella lansingensis]
MSTQEWPAEDYAIGSYIQNSIADNYLQYLTIKPTDRVLDIGCGNGAFSSKVIDKIPQGLFLGIDTSENMLKLARKEMANYPNASWQKGNVLTMEFNQQFDYIVSFWCLQWCLSDIETAFQNIYHALKPDGKVLTIFPSGDDPFVTSYSKVKASGEFNSLNNFKPVAVDQYEFVRMQERIALLPFKQIKIERVKHKLLLPSLDIFRKFVNGIAFFQGQIPTEEIAAINEAIVRVYKQECEEKYQGEYWFILSIYVITAEKW